MDASETLLPSWRDGATRQAIVDFVTQVTDPTGRNHVPEIERIAVFDNDGTLWCEKPMYIQLDFILRRLAQMAAQDDSLRVRQPWKSAYERDYSWLGDAVSKHFKGDDSDVNVIAGGILQAFGEMTVEEFETDSDDFMHNEAHPTLGRRYVECGYRPMVELLHYLEANGFTTYIASGGGRDFMRPTTQEMYGIPRERLIGSSVSLRYVDDETGARLVRRAEMDVLDDGPEKPVEIWNRVGRRPILAAGNSNGDIEMLRFSTVGARMSLGLLLLHDDAAREFDYVAGAETSLEMARREGWTVVSMKDDWTTVF